jgi:magnesium transporter
MLYEYKNELHEINPADIDSQYVSVGYMSALEFEKHYMDYGFPESAYNRYSEENKYFRSKIEVYDDYSVGTLKVIEPDMQNNNVTLLAFYIKKNLMLLIDIHDDDNSTRDMFLEATKRFSVENVTLEKFIFAFIDSLINDDNKYLEEIELQINKLEDLVMGDYDCKNFNEQLLKYKKKLLTLRNYYEQLIDIGEELYENENGLFEGTNLRYFKIFTEKSERLCSNVNLLRENLMQLREAYQSNLDIKLNNIMKVFTVVTAIFLPLTLIVGWYGMNFQNMPELTWKYGYATVIILSIIVVAICIYIFRKKKFM